MPESQSLNAFGEVDDPHRSRPTGTGIAIAIGAMMNAGMIVFVTAKFAEIFVDFDTSLPAITLAFVGPPPWVWPASLVAVAIVSILKDFVLSRRNRIGVDVIFGLLLVVVFLGYIFAMFMPLTRLVQGVSG